MDAAGVDRAVLVTPMWEGDRNDYGLAAAQAYPDRLRLMGRLQLQHPDPDLVERWLEQAGMLGIRVTFSREWQRSWLTDGTADWFWGSAERARVPVIVFAPGMSPKLAEIAERHPSLRLVVDHLGLPTDPRAADLDIALQQLIDLARYPNVATKVSGLIAFATDPYPFRSLHPRIARVIEALGPQRVLWATDLTRLPCSYREAKEVFTRELDFLSATDLDWIMGRAVATWLDWPA